MKVFKEVTNEMDFEFWGEARRTMEYLTFREQEQIFEILEELYPDGISETMLNDIFAFDRDFIAESLGFSNWDEFIGGKEE